MNKLQSVLENINYSEYKTLEIYYHTPIEKMLCSVENIWDMSAIKLALENDEEYMPLLRHVRESRYDCYDQMEQIKRIKIKITNNIICDSIIPNNKEGKNNIISLPDDFVYENINKRKDDLLFQSICDNKNHLINCTNYKYIGENESTADHTYFPVIIQE